MQVDARQRKQTLSPESLAASLRSCQAASRYWLAYSGGCDSHVLVHAAAQLQRDGYPFSFYAVHVDHGLQAASARWAEHCAQVCAALSVPLTVLQVNARAAAGESPEAAARHARYHALAEIMQAGDCLLTAHHQDDQAETLLLQLLRGGGPHGMAAMPEIAPFAAGWHARPLLAYSRDELRVYARRHDLRWIDDPSNTDTGFDRNYLRGVVMPLLRERWPAVARVLARGATHQAEAARLLDALALQDLSLCLSDKNTLSISALLMRDEARQRNVLRYWLKHLGYKLPDTARLAHIQQEVLHATSDREPEVHWEGVTVRRYRDRLYATPHLVAVDNDQIIPWDITHSLRLPNGDVLHAVTMRGAGVKMSLCRQQGVTVRFRQGGEECRPGPQAASRTLKNLLQEAGVPPWERERLPLIYVGEQLAAVADYWVCAPCQAQGDEEGLGIQLQRDRGVP